MKRHPARLALAALAALALLGSPLAAAPRSQPGDDGLDTPLAWANMCGAGTPDETHFTIAATGDTFPHENIQAVGEAEGYDVLFDHVRPFLKAADLAYTNFDGAMWDQSERSGYPNFNYNPALGAALKNAGIGLVSTANNHILDRGPEGLDATLDVFARNGILQHGTVRSAEAGNPRPPYLPITLSRGGVSIKLAFLSFSWGTNGIPDPYNQVNLLWESNDYGSQGGVRQSVLDAIAQARREADVVIVAAHWGEEYQFYPQPYQIEGARRLAEAGADVILGAQPHTLQPVDIIDTGGRKTLVIYSLANFLASQGAFQEQSYSATATIFYVGLIRHADGRVTVAGYRYLPTIHVDNDTRPAPIGPGELPDVVAHVRAEMRDPAGLRQISPDPAALGGRVEVCPAQAGGQAFGGDFTRYAATLGGNDPADPALVAALLGPPLGLPRREPPGDCRAGTAMLETERQRLELRPDAPWPYRVLPAPLGVAAYRLRYGAEPARRLDLTGPAFADDAFRAFFMAYGGLRAFGFPISGRLEEQGEDGTRRTVQYFERARMELVAGARPDAAPLQRVRLGALGRELRGASLCAPAQATPAESRRRTVANAANVVAAPLQAASAAPVESRAGGWWLGGAMLLAVATGAVVVWIAFRRNLRL